MPLRRALLTWVLLSIEVEAADESPEAFLERFFIVREGFAGREIYQQLLPVQEPLTQPH
jgi:hypothetical protein